MKLPMYPQYKPSGVAWLGQVPEHWKVQRLRHIAGMRVSNVDKHTKNDEQPVRLCNYVDVYKNDRITFGMAFMHATATADEIERFRLQSGDVLITKDSEAWNDIGVPALVEDTENDIVSGYHLALLRPFSQRANSGYLFRALQSTAVGHQFHVKANGVTRYGLSHSAIKSVWLPLPPHAEQRGIADFLDRETAKIDTLVGKKRMLIERLKEKRTALISRTVTRGLPPDAARQAGLDPHPKLKPSGVEWFGQVPEHWEVRRLKYSASINDEALSDTTDSNFEMSYVDISSVDPIRGIVSSEELMFEDAPSRARRIVCDGDTIVSTVRTYLRAIAPVRNRASNTIVSTGFAVVRPRRMLPTFLAYALSEAGLVEAIMARSVGVSYPAVNAAEIGTLPTPVPSDLEQRAIADFLDREMAKIDALVAKIETAVDRLREYRIALITAAVTGKIDVRDSVA